MLFLLAQGHDVPKGAKKREHGEGFCHKPEFMSEGYLAKRTYSTQKGRGTQPLEEALCLARPKKERGQDDRQRRSSKMLNDQAYHHDLVL